MEWMETYVFDLFDCKVCVCGDADCLRPDVDDDHDGAGAELLHEVVDLLVLSP